MDVGLAIGGGWRAKGIVRRVMVGVVVLVVILVLVMLEMVMIVLLQLLLLGGRRERRLGSTADQLR